MSLVSKIEYDHTKILNLMYDIEKLGNEPSELRAPLFHKLSKEITILAQAQERVLYPEAKRINSKTQLVLDLEDENEDIQGLLKEMEFTSETSAQWHVLFNKLKRSVMRHIEVEESKLLPAIEKTLRQSLDELEESLINAKNHAWNVKMDEAMLSVKSDFFATARGVKVAA